MASPEQRLRALGHRGARRLAVENSLESLRIAIAEGADGVEFDVQRTSDGELVLFHDDDLARLCGVPAPVGALTWRQLRDLPQRAQGLSEQRVAHLDEVIELFDGRPHSVNAELKVVTAEPRPAGPSARRPGRDGAGLALAEAFVRRMAAVDTRTWVVSSFHRSPLDRVQQAAAGLRLGALVEAAPTGPDAVGDWASIVEGIELLPLLPTAPAHAAGPRRDALGMPPPATALFSLHPEGRLVSAERLARWRSRGWQVWPWTVNDPRQWLRLAELGVDALITDDPGGLVRWLDRNRLR